MELLAILKAIAEAGALVGAIRGQIEEAKDVLTSNDKAEIDAALKTLQAQNDGLHAEVQDKLRG